MMNHYKKTINYVFIIINNNNLNLFIDIKGNKIIKMIN